jgi:hypothetical protein
MRKHPNCKASQPETRKQLRERAAYALDATHHIGERGPRTLAARDRIATALDEGKKPILQDIKWLESIAWRAQ